MKSIHCERDGHCFIFRYEPGDETAAIRAVCSLANQRQFPFDWLDAVQVNYMIRRIAGREAAPVLTRTGIA